MVFASRTPLPARKDDCGAGAGAGACAAREAGWALAAWSSVPWVAQPAKSTATAAARASLCMVIFPPWWVQALSRKLYLRKYVRFDAPGTIGAVKKAVQRRRMLEVLEQFRVIVKSIKRHYQDVERRA